VQTLFRRLAVFAGGWTPEAAAAVAPRAELGLDALEGLSRLVDASLVQASLEVAAGPRFRLLETVREYAGEQLDASGEREATERAHAAYFLALAEQAESYLKGPEQVAWYQRLQGEQDNLRVALDWAARQVSSTRAPAETLARLLGAIDVLAARVGLPLSPRQQAGHDQAVATVRAALGEDAFAAAWAAGRALPLDDARAEALAAVQPPPAGETASASTPHPRGILSAREGEVLSLVAEGLTNKQIADRLVIAEGTAKYHVTSLLNKLGADNRTQAVAHARLQCLV
jgi:DNA-binding CsgD family transcriptional regulator